MGQGYEQQMMMPAQPTAGFIVIETDFPFAFFKDDLDRPAHSADAHQVQQVDVCRGVAEVELDFRRVVHVAPDHQPDFRARQAVSAFNHAQESEITDDGTLAAFLDGGPCPGQLGNLGNQLLDGDRFLGWVAQTQSGGMAAPAFPGGNMHVRAVQPYLGGGLDFGEVPFVQGGHAVTKRRRITVQFIGRHPLKQQGFFRWFVAFHRCLQQFQPDFGLGLKNQVF